MRGNRWRWSTILDGQIDTGHGGRGERGGGEGRRGLADRGVDRSKVSALARAASSSCRYTSPKTWSRARPILADTNPFVTRCPSRKAHSMPS